MWMDLYAAVDYKFAGMSTVTLQAHVRTYKYDKLNYCAQVSEKNLYLTDVNALLQVVSLQRR